jgi:hypothetical protein
MEVCRVGIPKVISEDATMRRLWDIVILGLIFISCTMIPFLLVFQGQAFGKSAFILYAIDVFFFIDIWLNFRSSIRREGITISDRHEIATNYRRSFFPIDLVANFPFELLMILHPDATWGGVSAIALLRMLRLLRISRIFRIFRRWERMGWINPSYLRIAKFIGIMVLLMHWLACGWFQVAACEQFPADSWVVQSGIADAGVSSQYIRSLYWTITTMTTVGYGDIIPSRDLEFIVSMIVMLLGASMYAFIIGNVASLLSHLDSGKVNHWNRMETVTEYLRSRQVPTKLVTRVRDYYEYLWARHRGLPNDALVSDLPESLRLELLHCLASDLLENVPLFKYCKPALQDSLLIALKRNTYDPGSHVVNEGDAGKRIVFISQGEIDIIRDGKQVGMFQSGDYFGHMSMLLKEKRTASVVATTYCETFELSEDAYSQMQQNYPELRDAMKKMSSEASEKLAALMLEGVVL